MIIYDYDRITSEYIGQREARTDPLNPSEYLIPKYATDQKPLDPKAGNVACFINGTWQYMEDNRGLTVYRKTDAVVHVISKLGAIPDEFTALIPCKYPKWDGTQWITDTVLAEQAKITTRLNDIANNLPSWQIISDEYELLITDAQAAKDTADIKALATVLIKALRRSKKAERSLYWLAKNTAT